MNLFKATSHVARPGRALFPLSWFSGLLLFAYLWLSQINITHAYTLTLLSDTQTATAGYYQLRWELPGAPDDVRYHLQERNNTTEFATIYEGSDVASVISGKADGVYEYQILASSVTLADTVQGNTISVTVAHHSLTHALILFALGLFVFLGILISILRHVRANN